MLAPLLDHINPAPVVGPRRDRTGELPVAGLDRVPHRRPRLVRAVEPLGAVDGVAVGDEPGRSVWGGAERRPAGLDVEIAAALLVACAQVVHLLAGLLPQEIAAFPLCEGSQVGVLLELGERAVELLPDPLGLLVCP